jgi:hypothetical protein
MHYWSLIWVYIPSFHVWFAHSLFYLGLRTLSRLLVYTPTIFSGLRYPILIWVLHTPYLTWAYAPLFRVPYTPSSHARFLTTFYVVWVHYPPSFPALFPPALFIQLCTYHSSFFLQFTLPQFRLELGTNYSRWVTYPWALTWVTHPLFASLIDEPTSFA